VTDPEGLGDVVAEYDSAGNQLVRYDYAGGLLRQVAGGQASYFTFAEGGHTSELTDAAGAVTDSYFYDPFGAVLHQSGTTANPMQYAGELGIRTEGNGLEYMRNRFYVPELGQFLTEDPMRFPGVNNRT